MSITTRPEAVVAGREHRASPVRRVRIRNDKSIEHADVAAGPFAIPTGRDGSGGAIPLASPRTASRGVPGSPARLDRDGGPGRLPDRSYAWNGRTGRVSGAPSPPPRPSAEITPRGHLRRGDARLAAVNQLASDGPPIRLVGIEGPGIGWHHAPAGASIGALREAPHTQVLVTTHGAGLIDRLDPEADGPFLATVSEGEARVTGLDFARVATSSGSTWTRRADRSAWLGSNRTRGPGAAGDL